MESLCDKLKILNEMADIELEDVPNYISFIASVRLREIPFVAGSLISENYVMTLANVLDNCVVMGSKNELSCRIGEYLTNVDGIGISTEVILYHPLYNFNKTIANIAILKLEEKAIGMEAIKIPEGNLTYGTPCKIIGWSRRLLDKNTVIKRKLIFINVMLADIQECNKILLNLPHEIISNIPVLTSLKSEYHICLKSDRTTLPNLEDIGSLVVCNGEQFGIVVFKLYEDGSNDSSLFWISIRIDIFSGWIHEILNSEILEIFYAENVEEQQET